MFIAKDCGGHLRNSLKEDLPRGGYFCPSCGGELLLRKGQKIRAYFAHKRLAGCYYSNESAEHLALKASLFVSLSQKNKVQIEKMYVETAQIADLVVNDKLVLEIQCSPISTQKLQGRTQSYQKQDLYPIWLFGEKLWLKKRLSAFQRAVLSYNERLGFYFWELDNRKRELRLHYLIHEKLNGELVYLTKSCSFSDDIMTLLCFPFQKMKLQGFSCTCMPDPQNFVQKQLFYKNPRWLKEQERAYQRGENLLTQEMDYFFPQIKPARVNCQNYPNPKELVRYYKTFEAYYKNQGVKTVQTLYSPIFYDKMVEKQTRRLT